MAAKADEEKVKRSEKKKRVSLLSIKNETSVKSKIQKSLMFVVAVSMLVLGVVSCLLNYNSTMSTIQQNMQEIAKIASERVEWQITAYKNIIQELGRTARLANESYSVEEKQEIIDEKVEAYNCIRGKLIGMDGIALIDGTDYSEREYFQKAKNGETYLSEPLIAKTDGSIALIAAAPVWEGGKPDTTVVGVVFLSLQPSLLNDIVKSIYISDNSGAYIIDKNGSTVAHTTDGMMETRNNTIENAKTDSSLNVIAELEQKMIQGESGMGTYTYNGTTKVMAYAPIGNTDNWSLGVNAPTSDFLGDTIMGIIITIVIAVAAMIVAFFIAVKIGGSIGNPIQQCAERLSHVVTGDLQSPVPEIESQDEVGVLIESTREIIDGLNIIIGDIKYVLEQMAGGNFAVKSRAEASYVGDFQSIRMSMSEIKKKLGATLLSMRESSNQVNVGAGQMAESAQSLAEGATEQAGAIEELTATIENVTEIARQSAENAQSAYKSVDVAVEETQHGGKAMQDLTEAMDRITLTSQEIENIIAAIEDIASQTNLLSLNASIEAARAGEAGRGFAVVAEQIGKLAADSAQSATNTRALIVKVLEEIQAGNQLTGKAAKVFEEVIESMILFSKLARGSSDASDQQVKMLEEVEKGIEQISGVVQSNSAAAEETSATSEELSAQATTMDHLVSIFQLEE